MATREKGWWGVGGYGAPGRRKNRKREVQHAGMGGGASAMENLQKKSKLISCFLCFRISVVHLCSSAVCVFIPSIDRTATRSLSYVCVHVRVHVRVPASVCVPSPCVQAGVCARGRRVLNPKPSRPRRSGLLKHLSRARVRLRMFAETFELR